MVEHHNEVECEVCGYTEDLSTSKHTRIGWVCKECFPTYSIISDKLCNYLQVTSQREIKSTIVAIFK